MADHQKLAVVTGGAGFIGSHLCGRLVRDRWRVISLDNYFAGSKDNHIEGVEYREGHTKHIAEHITETPDIIYHLGEYSRVEQSVLEPDLVHDLNVRGTHGVLDFWVEKKCKFVYAGSSTKFGDGGLAREATPYASTKAANTEAVVRCGEENNLPYVVTYFYNVYGPGERPGVYGTVIEAFKQMHLRGTPLTVTSPGTQKRNFTHVDDVVEGLILVGQKGRGDGYCLGNERSFTILEVAKLFGGDVVMLPPRPASRTESSIDTNKSTALGWRAMRSLEDYIMQVDRPHTHEERLEHRVLVFSTTFYPVEGPAERALLKLIRSMPDVQFDIVTSAFSRAGRSAAAPAPNIHICRVGFGSRVDKFLLPILGYRAARRLQRKHRYLFAWSIMASYAALAAVLLRRRAKLPLLVTLADQDLEEISALSRAALRLILTDADQVYGAGDQESHAARLSRTPLRNSIGNGDAFANQLRYSYAEVLLNQESAL
ncbi:MAG: NAD-dependent epimerase/dehydratase family protein [Patescibacteria group bacterium]|nr:NAD-dependent epimerase/dehydratase family protein [Patescibacteria group bacterium]